MGQLSNNKYHITDDGKVYRINEDGSFSEIVDVTNLPSNQHNKGWFYRHYNWLWLIGLIAQLGFIISAVSCSYYREEWYSPIYDNNGQLLYTDQLLGAREQGEPIYQMYFAYADRAGLMLGCGAFILIVYIAYWVRNNKIKNNFLSSVGRVFLYASVLFTAAYMCEYCEEQYRGLVFIPGVIAFSLWALVWSLPIGKIE